ncbi:MULTISPECIES: MFS transporter [Enterobacteriaceae]|uniref:MFS transporter n=1 Tax=Enterobacteriaceae TaxID=543 RepID=UPI000237D272|nr:MULTISPECIES: MFS transporter [Enterobacteriaceae]QNE50935.1 MFS transporter [Klebsiella michiganensis]
MNERISTRIIFFVAGMATAAWAVIVPFAKLNTEVNDGVLGTLLLCLGFGAMAAMPLTGALTSRHGCRRIITVSIFIMVATLPLLAVINNAILLGIFLFTFGIGVGTTDCAMNVQAILVEQKANKPLMSGFHGMFSVGGIAGAGIMTGMLSGGLSVLQAALIVIIMIVVLLFLSFRHLLPYANPSEGPAFAFPKGIVLTLGLICFIIFMAEGTVLDWSAVYLIDSRDIAESMGGLGFVFFSTAMTAGRLTGDYIVGRFGALRIVLTGSVLALLGFSAVIWGTQLSVILLGYLFIGLGCSNIVPIMFSLVGKQDAMPQMVAVPAVTTLGYIGILAGPAIIGYISHHSSLMNGFIFVMGLVLLSGFLSYTIRGLLLQK